MLSAENAIRFAKDHVVLARELLYYARDVLKEEGKELSKKEKDLIDLLEKFKEE